VPTLRDVFERFGGSLGFYIDMKNKGFEEADQVAALIEASGMRERTVVASVDPLFISYLEHRHPGINTALERFDYAQVWLYQLIPTRWKPDYLSGLARKVSPEHVQWLQARGLLPKRIVYGADAPQHERMLRLGIVKLIVRYDPALHATGLSSRDAPKR
jgi:glycerophosphoryl diester phosphodiesterase